jgi:hypothetical protein
MKLLENHPEQDIKYAAIRGLIEGKISIPYPPSEIN